MMMGMVKEEKSCLGREFFLDGHMFHGYHGKVNGGLRSENFSLSTFLSGSLRFLPLLLLPMTSMIMRFIGDRKRTPNRVKFVLTGDNNYYHTA